MGLFTSHPIPAFGYGVYVVKPETTSGNNIPGYTTGYISLGDDPECPDTDAPMLRLLHRDDIWQVNGQDCAGGLGPADFINDWATPVEAIQDIRDFFFGDPKRMEAKAAFHRDPKGEIEKAKREGRMPAFSE